MYKAGSLITLETGEYSDFGYEGPYRVLRDIDVQAVVTEFKEARGHGVGMGETAFIAWLSRAGYIEDIDCARWYLGSAYPPYRPFKPDGYRMTPEATAASEAAAAEDRAQKEREHRKWRVNAVARRTDAFSEASLWAELAKEDGGP